MRGVRAGLFIDKQDEVGQRQNYTFAPVQRKIKQPLMNEEQTQPLKNRYIGFVESEVSSPLTPSL